MPGGLAALARARRPAGSGWPTGPTRCINTVVTNMPGPRGPAVHGRRATRADVRAGLIGDGMGLIHPVDSYCGELVISFTVVPRDAARPGVLRRSACRTRSTSWRGDAVA